MVKNLHDSMEEPPDIPIITGQAPGSKRKRGASSDAISQALTGAATAVSKYLSSDTSKAQPPNPSTPVKSSSGLPGLGISPLSKAKLTDQYLAQLQRLQGLLDNNVLTPEEFAEQKA